MKSKEVPCFVRLVPHRLGPYSEPPISLCECLLSSALTLILPQNEKTCLLNNLGAVRISQSFARRAYRAVLNDTVHFRTMPGSSGKGSLGERIKTTRIPSFLLQTIEAASLNNTTIFFAQFMAVYPWIPWFMSTVY